MGEGVWSHWRVRSLSWFGCVKWSERKGAQWLVIFGVYQKAESLHREPESGCAVCLSLPQIILPRTPSESKKTDTWKELGALNVIFWASCRIPQVLCISNIIYIYIYLRRTEKENFQLLWPSDREADRQTFIHLADDFIPSDLQMRNTTSDSSKKRQTT